MTGLKFTGNRTERLLSSQLNAMINVSKNAIIEGCQVTESSPAGMSINVASGRVFFGNDTIITTAHNNVTIDSNSSSNDRIDLIVINASDVVSVIKGTPSDIPPAPDFDTETLIVLASILVKDGVTSIVNNDIVDSRVFNVGGSGGNSGGTFGRHLKEFTSQTSVTVTHNLGDDEPFVVVYDNSGNEVTPTGIQAIDKSSLTVTFSASTSGKIIVIGGTGINNGYYYEEFTSQTTLNVTHNLNNKHVMVQVANDSNDIDPVTVQRIDDNNVTLTFSPAATGYVIVTGGVSYNNVPAPGTAGRILYDNGSRWVALAAGIQNQALISNGAAAPSWQNIDNIKKRNSKEISKLDVTDVSAAISFGSTTTNTVILINEGEEIVYFDFQSSSTVDKYPLSPGENIKFENFNKTTVSCICASGKTSTIKAILFDGANNGDKSSSEVLKISATDVSSSVTFSDTTSYKDILITNESGNDVYIDYDSGATTDAIRLFAGKTNIIENADFDSISAICQSGETATVKVLAIY